MDEATWNGASGSVCEQCVCGVVCLTHSVRVILYLIGVRMAPLEYFLIVTQLSCGVYLMSVVAR